MSKAAAGPLVLAREGTHGPVIHDVGKAALKLGIKRGTRVTDMRALVPQLRVEDAEPAVDEADLGMLSRWTRRWCPWSQTDGVDGLLLDTTGSAHLHGGEKAMVRDMRARFAAAGLTTRIAIAPTIGSAWALARRSRQSPCIVAENEVMEALAPLPVDALRLDPVTVLLLRRLGLKTIGALADVPRLSLVRRFRKVEAPDANPVTRLDQAFGKREELLVSPALRQPLRVVRCMAEPLLDHSGLERVLGDLANDLQAALEREGRGARGLRFTAYRVDGETCDIEVRTSRANRDPDHLITLFDGRLDRIDPGFGIEAASLEAIDSELLEAKQDELADKVGDDMDFIRLVDRLVARLGVQQVVQPQPRLSHLPERSEQMAPISGDLSYPDHVVRRDMVSPLRLLERAEPTKVIHAVPDGPPARFLWRHKLHEVARSAGPERIAPEWWTSRSTARLRDYYHVEDREGRRFWLYREGVAGDGRGGNPHWFVHGLDA